MKWYSIVMLLVFVAVADDGCLDKDIASIRTDICGKKYTKDILPDSLTAIRVAEAVLVPIYGKESVDSGKPYKATKKDDVWVIRGTLPKGKNGGVAEIVLSKKNGSVISICHGK